MGVWKTKASSNYKVYHAACGVIDGIFYRSHGKQQYSLSYCEAYDPLTDSWAIKNSATHARYLPAYGAIDGLLYVSMGYYYSSTSSDYRDHTEAYDPELDSWTLKNPSPQLLRAPASAVAHGKLYSFGGVDSSGYLSTTLAYDPSTNTWETLAPLPMSFSIAASALISGLVYVCGGWHNELLDVNYAYDPFADTWTAKSAVPQAIQGHAFVEFNGMGYIIGGLTDSDGDGATAREGLVFEYDPQTDSWQQLPQSPFKRYALSAATLDSGILINGGQDEDLNDITDATDFYLPWTAILFKDPTGDFYSDDKGNVLKLLDFGELPQGEYSQAVAVTLLNASEVTLSEVTVSGVDDGDPDTFEFSTTRDPFEALSSVTFTGTFASGDEIGPFYVRVKTASGSPTIVKQPKIKVQGIPAA